MSFTSWSVILAYLIIKHAGSVMLQQQFKTQNRNEVMMWPLNQEYTVTGLIECSTLCSKHNCTCYSFLYDSKTRHCSLGSLLLPPDQSVNSTAGKLFSTSTFCNVSNSLLQQRNGSLTPSDQLACAASISTTPPSTSFPSCKRVGNNYARQVVTLDAGIDVMCDTITDCGGWLVFQRRISGTVDFNLDWNSYKNGFGDYNIGEYYLGNDKLHVLTTEKPHEMRIDFIHNGKKYYARYTTFQVGNESGGYLLQVGGYSGNATDWMNYHNNCKFSTIDRDNDKSTIYNCPEISGGAWWYNSCYFVNLNSMWNTTENGKSISWGTSAGVWYTHIRFVEMRIRPI